MRREEDLRALMRDLARVDRAIMETGACLKPLYALQIGIRSLPHLISSYFQGLSDPSSSDSGMLEVVLRLMQKVVLDSEYKATVDSNIPKLLTYQPEQCLTCVNVSFGILLLPLLSEEEEEADASGPAAIVTLNLRKSEFGGLGGLGGLGFGASSTILRAGVEFVGASRFAIGLEDQPDGACAREAPAAGLIDTFRYSAGDEARKTLSSASVAGFSFLQGENGNAPPVPAQAEDVRGSSFVRIDSHGHGSSTREQRVVLRGAADKVVVESSHDYEESSLYQGTVEIEGALELKVTFDPKCHTKDNDRLRVGSQILCGCPIGFARGGFGHHSSGNWGDFTHIGSKIDFDFQASASGPRHPMLSSSGDRHWGWKFTVTATKFEEDVTPGSDSRSTDLQPENARGRLALSFLSSALNHELCRPLLTAPHRFKVLCSITSQCQ